MMHVKWLTAGLATAALIVGCSSSPPADKPGDEPATTATTSLAPTTHGSLAQCLSEYGIPAAPGPAVGPPAGVPAETWDEAMASCSSLAPGPGS